MAWQPFLCFLKVGNICCKIYHQIMLQKIEIRIYYYSINISKEGDGNAKY